VKVTLHPDNIDGRVVDVSTADRTGREEAVS
jgi:hypothetical protein